MSHPPSIQISTRRKIRRLLRANFRRRRAQQRTETTLATEETNTQWEDAE